MPDLPAARDNTVAAAAVAAGLEQMVTTVRAETTKGHAGGTIDDRPTGEDHQKLAKPLVGGEERATGIEPALPVWKAVGRRGLGPLPDDVCLYALRKHRWSHRSSPVRVTFGVTNDQAAA